MSNYIHNNKNVIIVQIIQQLQQWNKKPSLNDKISDFLDIFHESINNGQINFAEAGLFLQESTILHGKQIDLLYKGFLECHKNLSDVYNENKAEEEHTQNEIVHTKDQNIEIEKTKKDRKKCELKKPDDKSKDNVALNSENAECTNEGQNEVDLTNDETVEKISIPGIPDEILEKLKLSDCLPGGPIDEFIDKLDKNHPLYSVISKLGKEISQNRDIFTYNNISLSGMSWNALFKIEEVLSRINRKDDELDQNKNVREESQETHQIDDDSGIDTEHFSSDVTTGNSEISEVNATSTSDINTTPSTSDVNGTPTTSDINVTPTTSSSTSDVNTTPTSENSSVSTENQSQSSEAESQTKESETNKEVRVELTEELKEQIKKECLEKVVKINLLKLDFKLLTKKFNFRLPPELFVERRSERIRKRKAEVETNIPSKRKKIENNSTKQQLQQSHTPKSFDLELFENFCYNYYESQGIVLPKPQSIDNNRKSIDNRSEVSYGNPLTPADSGRFSLSFMTDSEYDHCDADENCRDSTVPFSRADSGVEVMGPFSPESNHDHQDDTPECEIAEEQSDTLKTLRTLFPATFSDPERAEALKALYKQPEDDENYMQWKKFIDDKTANEKDFNIHECGTDILNSFSLHSTDTLSFDTIVKDKSVGDISRYFVSTLQLANTYNVEIVDKYPGEIRPDNMQLKFLTNTRAHEEIDSHLNDISEDHFMESLMSNKIKRFHSTPMRPNPLPGPSTHKSTKRKRLEYCD